MVGTDPCEIASSENVRGLIGVPLSSCSYSFSACYFLLFSGLLSFRAATASYGLQVAHGSGLGLGSGMAGTRRSFSPHSVCDT
jgi:hypothetical protein